MSNVIEGDDHWSLKFLELRNDCSGGYFRMFRSPATPVACDRRLKLELRDCATWKQPPFRSKKKRNDDSNLCVLFLFSALQDCNCPFQGGSFFVHEGMPYCETHYHAKRGSLCAACHKPITGASIFLSLSISIPFCHSASSLEVWRYTGTVVESLNFVVFFRLFCFCRQDGALRPCSASSTRRASCARTVSSSWRKERSKSKATSPTATAASNASSDDRRAPTAGGTTATAAAAAAEEAEAAA